MPGVESKKIVVDPKGICVHLAQRFGQMSKTSLFLFSIALPATLFGVYAPIPEQEQGKAIVLSLESGFFYDSNILGRPDGEIDSTVFTVTPQIKYNASLEEQSFIEASYKLQALLFSDRPTEDTLYNHNFNVRFSHTFSPSLILEVSDALLLIDNPESFLLGLLQTNQSSTNNQFDFRLLSELSKRTSLTVKYRNFNYAYDEAQVASILDRNDNQFGIQVGYKWVPEASFVFEYRFQDRAYDTDGALKDSDSNFFLAGVDWLPNPKVQISGRIGVDDRNQNAGSSKSNFYGQLTGVYKYNPDSFLAFIVTYETVETSAPITFSGEETFSLLLNVQHALTSKIFLAGSIYYDSADLISQTAPTDITDNTVRFGFSAIYQPTQNWSVIFSYDLDDTGSDDFFRTETRSRVGISARYTFGL